MKNYFLFTMIFILNVFISSCGGGTDVVESGTYTGKIKKVEPEKTEIYVTIEDNKTLELYFIEETKLTRNGQAVPFSELEEGQEVEVEVKKVGNRLDPLSVKILSGNE